MFLLLFIFFAIVGYYIGEQRECALTGAILGFLLGPIGWAVTYFMFDNRPKCDQCGQRAERDARQCPYCHARFAIMIQPSPMRLSISNGNSAPPAQQNTNNLTPCPDCDRLISKLAVSCPQCGRPMNSVQITLPLPSSPQPTPTILKPPPPPTRTILKPPPPPALR